MDISIIKARILSRILDNLSKEQILKETVEDCDEDEILAKKLLLEVAKELL